MKVKLSTVFLLLLSVAFATSVGGSIPDPCYSCRVSGAEGQCTGLFPDAGFGFKNCSIVVIPRNALICSMDPLVCTTVTINDRECRTSNPCLLAPPF